MCQSCDCCHQPDHGACLTFRAGMNRRCVYCDHAEACHPGPGPLANGPYGPILIKPPARPGRPPSPVGGQPPTVRRRRRGRRLQSLPRPPQD